MTQLRELRLKKGLRILDVVCAIKVHASILSSVERGQLAVLAHMRKKLCSFFSVKPDKLFNENGIAV
jgi:transcriptional regulator with XRE-family HTH domain